MSRLDLYARALAALDEAALDDSQWPAITELLDEVCGTSGSSLVFSTGRSRKEAKIFFARICVGGVWREDLEREYFDVYYPQDEAVPRIRALPDGNLVHIADLYTEKEKKTSRTYNEFLLPNGAQNGINVRMTGPQESRVYWSVLRRKDSGGWKSDQIQMIERLLPHMGRFVQLRQVLFDARASRTSLTQLLDNTRCGIIQLDWRGRVVQLNDYAQNLLREGDGLFDKSGFLSARVPADNENLKKLLENALPKLGDPGVSGSVTVGRTSVAPRLLLYALSVGDGQRNFESARDAVLVLVVDPATKAAIDPAVVAAALDLTPSESRIASLLAEGNSIRDIAQSTSREESTIRWHIKHIFTKQGISRQAELTRRVLELAGYRL